MEIGLFTGTKNNTDESSEDLEFGQGWREEMGRRIAVTVRKIGSQQAAAAAAGLAVSTLQRWIRGEVNPSLDGVMRLSQSAGVDLEWLVSGTPETAESARNDAPQAASSLPDGQSHENHNKLVGARVMEVTRRTGGLRHEASADMIELALWLPFNAECDALFERLITRLVNCP